MARDVCNFYFSLWAVLPFTRLTAEKSKLKKKKKMARDIIILQLCTKNYDQMMYSSWDTVCDAQTDRRTVGRTDEKSDT